MANELSGKRILVAKPGLDGHDIGAKIITVALRDAGAEVIYTGLRKTPDYIARIAIDEDVDAVGLSMLSGSHCELVAQVIERLQAQEAGDLPVFVGGTIPEEDHARLREMGVQGIFTSRMALADVVSELAKTLV